MSEKKKKNGKLFLFIGAILAATVIGLNLIQILIVSNVAKKEIEEDSLLQYESLAEQCAVEIRNYVDSHLSKMDFYINSEVIEDEASTEEIVSWLESVSGRRSSEFEYIGYVDMEGNNYTDQGATSNVSDRDYYQAIANGADFFIDNPVLARSTGRVVVHVCKAAKSNGRTIGFFYGIMDPAKISEACKEVKLPDGCEFVVFGNDGTVIGTDDDDKEFEEGLQELKEKKPDQYSLVEQAWLSSSEYSVNFDDIDGPHILISEPIENAPWNVAVFLNEAVVYHTVTVVSTTLVVGSFILAVLIIVIVGTILLLSIKPLTIVETTIRGIATGDADLTRRIDLHSNNEIGRVVEGFNLFSEKLQTIIATMKTSKEELVEAGQLLQDSTHDTTASITQIIGNIESMGTNINTQTESVHQTAGAVNEIASNIESLNRMIENQSSSVTQASAAVEEMIGNINSVNNSVQKMANAFEELERKAVVGVQKQNDVNAKIAEIETESQALQEANAVISGIAEQTNLLAMNAAIEAAHAGEAGKGFSVVADEIRKLSEDSGAQSQTIGNQLSKITMSIEQIVEASKTAADAFSEVSNGINNTNNLVREISNAMLEQGEGSKQISIALNALNDSSNEVKTASFEMSEGNKAILEEVKNLQDASFAMKDGMDEMSVGARKINETGAALSDLSSQMEESIKKIGEQVDQFKV